MALDDDEIEGSVQQRFQELQDRWTEARWFEAAYENDFWRCSPFGENEGAWSETTAVQDQPVRFQTNQIATFIGAHVAHLYARNPRSKLSAPSVLVDGPGRPAKPPDPASVSALLDDWLMSEDMVAKVTQAFQLALMHGVAAFKLGVREKGDPMSRVWVDTIPMWELLLNDRARNREQQLYIGHMRWERRAKAEAIVGASLADYQAKTLPDWLDRRQVEGGTARKDPARYVQLLELYDFEAEKLRYFTVDGYTRIATVAAVGKIHPIPWDTFTGHPMAPINPVVLWNVPHMPLKGIPAVRRVYQHNAETNLLLTTIADQFRQDAARVTAVLKREGHQELLEAIASGDASRIALIEGASLEGLWKHFDPPPFAPSVGVYMKAVEEARQDAQGFADIMTGKQGKYLTAEEAKLLAGAGEVTTSEIGNRMARAMAGTASQFLVMLASVATNGLRVMRGDKTLSVSGDDLRVPWQIEIQDATATPVRDAQKKAEFGQWNGVFLQLVAAASGSQAPPQVQAAAQELVDYAVTLYQLPDSMKWESIERKAKQLVKQLEAKAQAAAPEPQAGQLTKEQADALVAQASAAQGIPPANQE